MLTNNEFVELLVLIVWMILLVYTAMHFYFKYEKLKKSSEAKLTANRRTIFLAKVEEIQKMIDLQGPYLQAYRKAMDEGKTRIEAKEIADNASITLKDLDEILNKRDPEFYKRWGIKGG